LLSVIQGLLSLCYSVGYSFYSIVTLRQVDIATDLSVACNAGYYRTTRLLSNNSQMRRSRLWSFFILLLSGILCACESCK
jgi:hypothetical protein